MMAFTVTNIPPLPPKPTPGQLTKTTLHSFLNKPTHRSPALSDLVSKIWGCKKGRQEGGCLPAREVGAELFLPGWFLQSSGLSLELYLASTRSPISQDDVWAPRATFIPCWYAVSAMYTAVENHSSSLDAAQRMLMGLEH